MSEKVLASSIRFSKDSIKVNPDFCGGFFVILNAVGRPYILIQCALPCFLSLHKFRNNLVFFIFFGGGL